MHVASGVMRESPGLVSTIEWEEPDSSALAAKYLHLTGPLLQIRFNELGM